MGDITAPKTKSCGNIYIYIFNPILGSEVKIQFEHLYCIPTIYHPMLCAVGFVFMGSEVKIQLGKNVQQMGDV
jgi:hypothetical protein